MLIYNLQHPEKYVNAFIHNAITKKHMSSISPCKKVYNVLSLCCKGLGICFWWELLKGSPKRYKKYSLIRSDTRFSSISTRYNVNSHNLMVPNSYLILQPFKNLHYFKGKFFYLFLLRKKEQKVNWKRIFMWLLKIDIISIFAYMQYMRSWNLTRSYKNHKSTINKFLHKNHWLIIVSISL